MRLTKKYISVIASFFLSLFQVFSKQIDNKEKKELKRIELDVIYNQYLQDGNNSAITGGIGTENLKVYGPSIVLKKINNNHSTTYNLGADLISSPSVDKIDTIDSSASVLDARSYLNITHKRILKDSNSSIYGGVGLSIESDYTSLGTKLGFTKNDERNLRTYLLEFQMFNDDLRWGRLNPDYMRPVKLIYPIELRSKEWYDTYKRNSFNLKLGVSQVLSKRNILGIFPEVSYQNGLLATPFHRIYFRDGSIGVEQLPKKRFKASLGLKLHSFVGGNLILKNSLNPYFDDFGIISLAIENETVMKLNRSSSILVNLRFYTQKESKYFKKYKEHNSKSTFYTSDFDLSRFETYTVGTGFKHKTNEQNKLLDAFTFRYSYVYRTTKLSAHLLSAIFKFSNNKKNKYFPLGLPFVNQWFTDYMV